MVKILNNYNSKFENGQKSAGCPSFGAFKPVEIGDGLTRAFSNINEKFGTPQQRMVIGGSALFLQPMIDLNNKNVDDKTKQTAATRSFSRAIIGTLSGIAVRCSCIEIGKQITKEGGAFYIDALKKANPSEIRNYSRTIGNILALGTLLVTNFLVDVPLINKMSGYINEKVFGNKPKEVVEGKVKNA